MVLLKHLLVVAAMAGTVYADVNAASTDQEDQSGRTHLRGLHDDPQKIYTEIPSDDRAGKGESGGGIIINNNDKIPDDCSTTLSAKDIEKLMFYVSDQELIVATRAHQLKQAAEMATTELASQMLLKEYSGAAVEAAVSTQRDADHAGKVAMNAVAPCARRQKETPLSGIVHVPLGDKQEEHVFIDLSFLNNLLGKKFMGGGDITLKSDSDVVPSWETVSAEAQKLLDAANIASDAAAKAALDISTGAGCRKKSIIAAVEAAKFAARVALKCTETAMEAAYAGD